MNFNKLTEYLDSLEERYGVPGYDIRITRDHQTVYRHMGGYSDYEKKKPVSDRDLYYIYSATKVITMTAAMQLIEQGKMGLDDPVEKYLPEFHTMRVADHYVIGQWPPQLPGQDDPCHAARTPITLRMLMTMTAGLSYDTDSQPIRAMRERTNDQATTRDMMRSIAQMPLLFEPGTHYSYSLGHDVMAGVIEVVSGKTFGQYLKENLFDPLDVRDMYFHLDETLRPRLAAQYAGVLNSDEIRPTAQTNSYCLSQRYESGGAGIACTVDAYSTVMDALANGGVGNSGARILRPESIAALAVNQLPEELLPEYQAPWRKEYGYGLGVRTLIRPEASPSPQGEFGWDGAAGAYALVDPVNHVSIFYAQEILGMMRVYSEIHPMLRSLVYECLRFS